MVLLEKKGGPMNALKKLQLHTYTILYLLSATAGDTELKTDNTEKNLNFRFLKNIFEEVLPNLA